MNIMNSAYVIFVVSWSVTQCPHVFRTFGMWIPHPIRSDFGCLLNFSENWVKVSSDATKNQVLIEKIRVLYHMFDLHGKRLTWNQMFWIQMLERLFNTNGHGSKRNGSILNLLITFALFYWQSRFTVSENSCRETHQLCAYVEDPFFLFNQSLAHGLWMFMADVSHFSLIECWIAIWQRITGRSCSCSYPQLARMTPMDKQSSLTGWNHYPVVSYISYIPIISPLYPHYIPIIDLYIAPCLVAQVPIA